MIRNIIFLILMTKRLFEEIIGKSCYVMLLSNYCVVMQ